MEIEINHSQSNYTKKLKIKDEDMVQTTNDAGSISESHIIDNPINSNAESSSHDDEIDEYDGFDEPDDGEDASDYESDDYVFDDEGPDEYSSLQAQFDNVDLPPGVEASVSWLQATTLQSDVAANGTPAANGTVTSLQKTANQKNEIIASSSSSAATRSGSHEKENLESADDFMEKYMHFKRFDVVEGISDHYYSNLGSQGHQPSKAWMKKIQDEWKILEDNLPDTIFVRVYESRMDLLTSVIIGPQGTPYHDGLFVFDAHFPPNYPDVPPMVYYYSGGVRLNPNLYECGKVCLSLLNTWTGKGNEKWVPKKSTMLQVLLSIQALILNAKPFFNEPGHEKSYVGTEGVRMSRKYNENIFILSLKTMIYTLRRPPKHFEPLVAGHFRTYAHEILSSCKEYMDGAEVGSLVKGKIPEGASEEKNVSREFKEAVAKMVNGLVANFTRNGATDCEQYKISG